MDTIREFAERVLTTEDLARKLVAPPLDLTDDDRRPAIRPAAPGRPPSLRFADRRRGAAMPSLKALVQPEPAARCLHILANHELQAVELFAFALLAYPEAPDAFRRGLLRLVAEEQTHVRLYLDRLAAYGACLGDYPVNGYLWSKAARLETPLHFVSAVNLVFEGSNLDHSLELEAAFRAAGDEATADLMARVHADEIGHVRFGHTWLVRLAGPDADPWQVWNDHLVWPLRPEKARGEVFRREARRAAGMSEDFIDRLEETVD